MLSREKKFKTEEPLCKARGGGKKPANFWTCSRTDSGTTPNSTLFLRLHLAITLKGKRENLLFFFSEEVKRKGEIHVCHSPHPDCGGGHKQINLFLLLLLSFCQRIGTPFSCLRGIKSLSPPLFFLTAVKMNLSAPPLIAWGEEREREGLSVSGGGGGVGLKGGHSTISYFFPWSTLASHKRNKTKKVPQNNWCECHGSGDFLMIAE